MARITGDGMGNIATAFASGVKRVNRAPAVLAGVALLTFLAALPLGLVLRQMIAESLGASAVATAPSWNPASVTPPDFTTGFGSTAWLQQFSERATGVGRAFSPSTFGFAAVLDNLSSLLDNRAHALPIVVAGAFYAIVWVFLSGGILDRYARNHHTRAHGFFAACGGYFFRLVRLSILAAVVFLVVFTYLHPLLQDAWESLIRDYTSESRAFALRVVLYVLVGGIFCLCNLVFDYARVRTVVEDRRSMLAAIAATAGFARRRPAIVALYLLDGCCFLLVLLLYSLVAPGLRAPAWWVLLVGQAYVLARIWVKLLFYSTEVAYFQGALAHAEYTAAPLASWPDSPAADAIGPN